MTFTKLSAKATGQVVSASGDWNPGVVDNINHLGGDRPMCKAYRSTTQPIVTATETPLQWDAENWDSGGMHSTSSMTSRMVIPYAGRYRVETMVRMDAGTFAYYFLFRLNGVSTDTAKVGASNGFTNWGDTLALTFDCATNDYFEVGFYHNKGSNLNVRANSWMSLEWVGFTP